MFLTKRRNWSFWKCDAHMVFFHRLFNFEKKKKGELGYFENVIPHNVFWSNFFLKFFNFLIFGDPHKEAWRVRCSSNSKSLPINVWGRWWGWFILSSHNQKKPKMEIFHVSITSFMISIFTNWSSGFWMAT